MSGFERFLKTISEHWPGTLLVLLATLLLLGFAARGVKVLLNKLRPPREGEPVDYSPGLFGWLTNAFGQYGILLGFLLAVGIPVLVCYLVIICTLDDFTSFLKVLSENWNGVAVLLIGLLVLMSMLGSLARVFAFGRHQPQWSPNGGYAARPYSGVLYAFIAKIINQFRHLLALVVVLIFAIALAYAMWMANDTEELAATLQAVMATLGGLVGSIIGYYFGESKGDQQAIQDKVDPNANVPEGANAAQDLPDPANPPAGVNAPAAPDL